MDSPLEQFFSQYPWFEYDPLEPASAQFNRLRKEARWKKGDDESDEAWEAYRTALVRQFNTSFASDEDDLDAWHALLGHIGIVDAPLSVHECKKLISGKFINLVDLIDARDDPSIVITHFPTELALSGYTLETKKFFPRNHAEAGGLLSYLLRNIMDPDPKRTDPSQQSGYPRRRKKRHRR